MNTKQNQSSEGRSSAKWDAFAHVKFIEICEDEIGKGNRANSHFNLDGWKNLGKRFNEVTGRNYVYKQLRNHWDSMKKEWILFKNLMQRESGIGWNPMKNSIDADDKWWERKIKENIEYGKFRNKDLSLIWFRYDNLFTDVAATGERARAPSQISGNDIGGSDNVLGDIGESNENEGHTEIGIEDIGTVRYSTNSGAKDGNSAHNEIVFPSLENLKRKFCGENSNGKKKVFWGRFIEGRYLFLVTVYGKQEHF